MTALTMPARRVTYRRLPFDALSIVGLALVLFVGHLAASDGVAIDGHAYWLAEYGRTEGSVDAFVYPPPAYIVSQAFGALPWPVFLELYTAAIAVGVWLLAGPLTLFVVFTPQVASELMLANVHVFLALVSIAGLRWPALWSFALLTKVSPGVGVLWFAFRGEWRKLAIALGVTAAIALPTVVLTPHLWLDWLEVLRASTPIDQGGPLMLRLPIAVALLWIGARRNWPVVVPVAAMIALPVLWSIHSLSMLLGVAWYIRRIPLRLPS